MKRFIFLISLILACASVIAQPAMKLSASTHDFGKFKEEAGMQSFDFIVTNTGNSALEIRNIVASCGCTIPDWTRQPIPAGGSGKITAKYDPKNRPGVFQKTLSIYTNSKPEVVVLVIKGEVIPREKTIEELYIFPVGPVRFENSYLAFTNVKKNEKKIKVMPVINTSKEAVKVEFEGLPAHLSLKVSPETLKPGQKGLVEGTYDATKNPTWGDVYDYVRIKINGVLQEKVNFIVAAKLVEDFSQLSKEDMANAPVLTLASTTVDIGKIPGSTVKDVEFKFTNEGKNDLIIRHVRSTCGCTAVHQGTMGKGIKPGESSSIKATFNSGNYRGKQTKFIYVYTNDPKNSEVVLTLNAEVEQSGIAQ